MDWLLTFYNLTLYLNLNYLNLLQGYFWVWGVKNNIRGQAKYVLRVPNVKIRKMCPKIAYVSSCWHIFAILSPLKAS